MIGMDVVDNVNSEESFTTQKSSGSEGPPMNKRLGDHGMTYAEAAGDTPYHIGSTTDLGISGDFRYRELGETSTNVSFFRSSERLTASSAEGGPDPGDALPPDELDFRK